VRNGQPVLHLKSEEAVSLTMQLRFIDKAGRYILQQRIRRKRGTVLLDDRWQDVELVREAVR
jgi:hypothetical protein